MVDRQNLGQRVSAAMRDAAAARIEMHRSRERLAGAEAARAAFGRVDDPNDRVTAARRQQLDADVARLQAELETSRATFTRLSREAARVGVDFEPFSDPRTGFDGFDDRVPTLLFPVRLETRFMVSGTTSPQLWVRVYPDDCVVDTFESTMSDDELANVEDFWTEWAAAGGLDDGERGAWRALAGDLGSGRAGWLTDQYQPLNLATLPEKTTADAVFLVVATETPLPAPEAAAAAAFWLAVWEAGDNGAAHEAAENGLRAAVGDARADDIIENYRPANLDREPFVEGVPAEVVFVELPPAAGVPTQRVPWSQPATVDALPEQLVLLGYRAGVEVVNELGARIPSPLPVGPDPLAEEDEQLRQIDSELDFGPLEWMADFEAAVRIGMGFRVDLDADDVARGFDELVVLGVRLAADRDEGQRIVETLFRHHQEGTAGFGLLPTGAATNNTEEQGSGYGASEDTDDTFEDVFGDRPPLARVADHLERPDAQWLADALGLDLATFERTPNARGTSMCEARAMNTALWPATWGYFMESMMGPVFDDDVVETTRWFFTRYVTGRGLAPAVRIGDQPYGILPTTAFSRATWLQRGEWSRPRGIGDPDGSREYLAALDAILRAIRVDWAQMADEVATVDDRTGSNGRDPHQTLLDVVGLSPASVEYHRRWAESLEEVTNRLKLAGLGGVLVSILIGIAYTASGMNMLGRLGHRGGTPEILEKFFLQDAKPIDGDLVDDQPLSEQQPIRAWTDGGDNYIEWLVDAATTSFERLRKEEGFVDDRPPRTLLYLLLRYALEQGYWDTGLRVLIDGGALTAAELATARVDPSFVHVAEEPGPPPVIVRDEMSGPAPASEDELITSGKPIHFERASESRYDFLYRAAPDDGQGIVAEMIPTILGTRPARFLDDQLRALGHLAASSTARLERAMAEHLDLGSYRLDAWRWGLLNYQLAALREGRPDDDGTPSLRTGVYVGAFGWLRDVRPEPSRRRPARLDDDLDAHFNPQGVPAAETDSANEGYIHAPSLNHAVTAAILRNGFVSSATKDSPNELAVNLTSGRVRAATAVIEGLRNGQSLNALLGFRFERGLHDRHGLAEVDRFIYALRRKFSLVANHLKNTAEPDEPIQAIEARNVVDGLALAVHVRDGDEKSYPFGLSNLPDADGAQRTAIDAEVNRLLDVHDAVADLATAEAVHQAVLGNYERTSATLDAFSEGSHTPDPEVIRTPRTGITLTHRVAIQLEAGRDPTVSPNALPVTARALAEPAVNAWLDGVLPAPATVACLVDVVGSDGMIVTPNVGISQADLRLQPLDLLHAFDPELDQAMTALDDRIEEHVRRTQNARPDAEISIRYQDAPAGSTSFFKAAALVESLRELVFRSRPLTASDAVLSVEASEESAPASDITEARIRAPRDRLNQVIDAGIGNDDLTKLANDLAGPLGDTAANQAVIVAQAEAWAARFVVLASDASWFGIEQAAIGFVADGRRRAYVAALEVLDGLLTRWQKRLDDFDAAVPAALALPTPEEQLDALRWAERLVTTEFATSVPTNPAAYATALNGPRGLLAAKRGAFAAIRQTPPVDVAGLVAAIAAEAPIAAFDTDGIDLSNATAALVTLAVDVGAMTTALKTEITTRVQAADDGLAAATAAASPSDRTDRRLDAARALFGEGVVVVPEFDLGDDHGTELANAFADRATLLRHLTDPPPTGLDVDFPVDDWLHGVARVRDKLAAWEHVVMATDALGTTTQPELTALQLPYRPDDFWLGLDFPKPDDPNDPRRDDLEGEHLAYTAHFTVPFDNTLPQCGLLLDEWTEVIPSRNETTGVAFHFDQPNTEPPQAMLLVTSPTLTGRWRWQDLVDAVRETFDEARLRAVEPSQVDDTPYARFAPTALMSTTLHPINIGLNLALSGQVTAILAEDDDG